VGGGVKLRAIEVATINSLLRQILLGLFGASLCIAGIGTGSSGDDKEAHAAAPENAVADAGPEANSSATPQAALAADTSSEEDKPVQDDTSGGQSDGPVKVTTRALRIANDCSSPVVIRLVYKVDGDWLTKEDAVWTLDAGQNSTLTYNGSPVELASDELYMVAKAGDGVHIWNGDYRVGAVQNLRQANVTLNGDGEYETELTCS